MATAPVKSQPLHNFSLPSFLNWGSANTTNQRCQRRPPPSPSPDTDKNYSPSETETLPKTAPENDEEPSSQKPWNLRPRKPPVRNVVEFKEPASAGGSGSGAEREENQRVSKSSRFRGHGGEGSGGGEGEKKEKRRFWIALSKEEIEEDVFVMTGSRPARRPKKRARNVQKQLDCVFPGLWLVGVTADAYRIAETPSKK